jgi:hypothetical protein
LFSAGERAIAQRTIGFRTELSLQFLFSSTNNEIGECPLNPPFCRAPLSAERVVRLGVDSLGPSSGFGSDLRGLMLSLTGDLSAEIADLAIIRLETKFRVAKLHFGSLKLDRTARDFGCEPIAPRYPASGNLFTQEYVKNNNVEGEIEEKPLQVPERRVTAAMTTASEGDPGDEKSRRGKRNNYR